MWNINIWPEKRLLWKKTVNKSRYALLYSCSIIPFYIKWNKIKRQNETIATWFLLQKQLCCCCFSICTKIAGRHAKLIFFLASSKYLPAVAADIYCLICRVQYTYNGIYVVYLWLCKELNISQYNLFLISFIYEKNETLKRLLITPIIW